VHRLTDLSTKDLGTVDSIPATTATRTLLDAAALTSDAELRMMVDRARGSGLTHLDVLSARFGELAPRRPAGAGQMRRVLSEIQSEHELLDSDLEARLLRAIIDAGLPAPIPQFQVAIGAARYRLDFAYPTERLAIEGDGFAFHAGREQFENDRRRQNDLVLAGWRILRFTWRQVCGEPVGVAQQIAAALREPSPTALR
jgi:very-short-patch-repair endonuclease